MLHFSSMEPLEPLEDVLAEVLDSRMAQVHTAIPCRVEKYYSDAQTVDCKPMVKQVGVDETGALFSKSYPILPRVPVAHPRGGGFFVHFPIAKGDFVFVIFCEASIDQWRAKDGRETHPGDIRRHSLGNAVAYPGLYPTSAKLTSHNTTDMVIGEEGGLTINIEPGGKIRLGNETVDDLVALSSKVDSFISALDTLFRTTWVPVTMDGGAALKTAYTTSAFPSPPASVAATKVTAL